MWVKKMGIRWASLLSVLFLSLPFPLKASAEGEATAATPTDPSVIQETIPIQEALVAGPTAAESQVAADQTRITMIDNQEPAPAETPVSTEEESSPLTEAQQLTRWINDLDSGTYAAKQAAATGIQARVSQTQDAAALATLLETLATASRRNVELRRRIEDIVEQSLTPIDNLINKLGNANAANDPVKSRLLLSLASLDSPMISIARAQWLIRYLIKNNRAATLTELVRSPSFQIRYRLAGFSSAPGILTALSEDTNVSVRYSVGKNSETPGAALAALAERTLDELRQNANPNSPARFILYAIAENPHAPPATLTTLSRNTNDSVRRLVAKNPSAPPETLDAMVRVPGEDVSVRVGVARNLSATKETLRYILENDQYVEVRTAAQENLNSRLNEEPAIASDQTLITAIENQTPTDQEPVILPAPPAEAPAEEAAPTALVPETAPTFVSVMNTDTVVMTEEQGGGRLTATELSFAIRDLDSSNTGTWQAASERLRAHVEQSRDYTALASVLERFAAEAVMRPNNSEFHTRLAGVLDQSRVRIAALIEAADQRSEETERRIVIHLARLGGGTSGLVEELFSRGLLEALITLVQVPETDLAIRLSISERENLVPDLLHALAQDEDTRVRYRVAMHADVHPITLDMLSHDTDWLVRSAVIRNPNTWTNTVRNLAQDSERVIALNLAMLYWITPVEALNFLALHHEDEEVRAIARESLDWIQNNPP